MALDARRRSLIYQSLVPVIGDENANALMSEFPAVEADELVTKRFLRAELAEFEHRLLSQVTVRLMSAIAVATAVLGLLISLN